MYNPWDELRRMGNVRVQWAELPNTLLGATDGKTIWIDTRLNPIEQRCVLTHELVHVQMGHTEEQDEETERLVRRITAERLVSLQAFMEVAHWTHTTPDLAAGVWVTEKVLKDRLRFSDPDEWLEAWEAMALVRMRWAS